MLALVVLVVFASSWSEGTVLSKCDLKSRLKEAFPKLHRFKYEDVLAQFVCTVEHTSWFNTRLVSNHDYFNYRHLIPTLTMNSPGEKRVVGMNKNLLPELMNEEKLIYDEKFSTDMVKEDYLALEIGILKKTAGLEAPLTPFEVISEDGLDSTVPTDQSDETPIGAPKLYIALFNIYHKGRVERQTKKEKRTLKYNSGDGLGEQSEGTYEDLSGDSSGDYVGEGSSKQSVRNKEFSQSVFEYYSGEGSGKRFSRSISGDYSGEGSGEDISKSDSEKFHVEGSGERFFRSVSGDPFGEGSGEEVSGSGSGNDAFEGSVKRLSRSVSDDPFGEGSGEEVSGSGSGNAAFEVKRLSRSVSGDPFGEGSGEEVSGSGSGNAAFEVKRLSRSVSGDPFGEGSGEEVSGSGSGENSGDKSGKSFSISVLRDYSGEELGEEFIVSHSREGSSVQSEFTKRSKRDIPEDGPMEGSGNESSEGSGIYSEKKRKKRAIHREDHVGDQKEMDKLIGTFLNLEHNQISKDSSRKQQGNSRILYGIFQLTDIACNSGSNHSLNLCRLDCTALTDDDITDDIACLKILNKIGITMMVNPQCLTVKPADYFLECS